MDNNINRKELEELNELCEFLGNIKKEISNKEKDCSLDKVAGRIKKKTKILVELQNKNRVLDEESKKKLKEDLEKIELANENEINKVISISYKIRGDMGRLGDKLVEKRMELSNYYKEIKKEL